MKNTENNYALLNITKLLSPDLSTYRREELSRAVDTLERAGAIVWPKDNPCKRDESVAYREN